MTLPPRLADLFQEFERAGIRWCLLRLPERFTQHGGDIDLLVSAQDLPAARAALASQQFARLPAWEPALHYLAYDCDSGGWLWLHLVTELAFGPYELARSGCEAQVLQRRQRDPLAEELFWPADEDAFWELLLHCLTGKGRIAARHRARLQRLAQAGSLDSPLAGLIADEGQAEWNAHHIGHLAAGGQWDVLEAAANRLTAVLLRRAGVGIWQRLRARLDHNLHRLQNSQRSRGLRVAFLGPDGAGKSTLIAGLQTTWMLPVVALYMGLTGGLLRYVDRLWLPFLVIPGRVAVLWARYLRGIYHQARGRLVLYDRYVYDWAVPTPYPLNRLQRLVRWIDGHCLPGPDLVLILDAPGALMFQRKGEYDADMLETWRQRFLALGAELPNAVVVDTAQPAQVVLTGVTDLIWQRLAERWIEKNINSEKAAR